MCLLNISVCVIFAEGEGLQISQEEGNQSRRHSYMSFEEFYAQVHKQALERNFVRFRRRILVSRESYHLLSDKEREFLNDVHALVLVFSKIDWFMYFNEESGVGLSTQVGSHLQFDIKYYETLRDIGVGGQIHAMCVLPAFDKCILLGYEAFR